MEQLLKDIFAEILPEDYCHSELIEINEQTVLRHTSMSLSTTTFSERTLPPGSYEILFTTKKVSEEDAKKIVGKEGVHPSWPFNPLYTNYGKDRIYIDDARESLQSLLRSKNLDPARNYLLIKKL